MTRESLIAVAAWLAMLVAVGYTLLGMRVLSAGAAEGPPWIAYVAAACYALGGLLILAQRRWLWILGATINALVMLTFVQAYQSQPQVLLSSGAAFTKTLQLALEALLLYLVLADWLETPRGRPVA
jgi:hypothetical protein